MKRTLLFFACLLGMLTSFSASAQWKCGVDQIVTSEGKSLYGPQTDLPGVKSVKLQVAYAGAISNDKWADNLKIAFTCNGKTTYPDSYSTAGRFVDVEFNTPLTAPGTYTITIPENSVMNSKPGYEDWNKTLTIENAFSIKGNETPVDPTPTTKWQAGVDEIYNAAGDQVVYQNEDSYKNVEGLSKLILWLTYPMEMNRKDWAVSTDNVYLTLNGEQVKATSVSAVGMQITMTFDPALLTPGTYAAVIGKDCAQNQAGEWNPEIVINNAFTLKEAAPKPAYELTWREQGAITLYKDAEGNGVNIYPSEGASVEDLESVLEFDYKIGGLTTSDYSALMRLTTDESLISSVYIKTANGEPIQPKTVSNFGTNVTFGFDPLVTEPGVYTLYLPEGLIYIKNENPACLSPAAEIENIFSIKGEEPQPTHTITWTGLGLLKVKENHSIDAGGDVQNLESVTDFNFYMTIDPALEMFEKFTDFPKINESLIPSTYVEVNGERISPKSVAVRAANYCEFVFDPILTAAGTYSLYLPEGLVYMQNDGAKSEAAEFLNIFSIKDNEDPKPTFNLTDYTLDPESGAELPYIAGIELKFPESGVDGDEYFFSMDDELAVTLTDEAGNEYNPVRMGIMMTDIDAFVISFGSVDSGTAIMTPGTYTLVIPEGKFFIYDTDAKNPRIEATYVIKSPGVSFDNYGLNPANGSTVTTLGHIYLTFPDAVSEDNLDNDIEPNVDLFEDLTEIYLTDPNGEKIGLEGLTMPDDITLDLVFGDYREWVEGEYTLTVPAAFFRCTEYHAVVSPAITATYTLVAAVDPLAEWTIDPAEGKVESLEKFVITYPYITENGGYINGPEEGTTAALYKDGVKVTDAYVGSIEYKQIRITLDEEITAPGEYTLIVDGDMFCYESEDGVYGNYNPVMKFSYTIDTPDGVEAILAGADNFTVVDAAGRVIVRNGEKSVLSQLEKGLYIINGQKVVIRK